MEKDDLRKLPMFFFRFKDTAAIDERVPSLLQPKHKVGRRRPCLDAELSGPSANMPLAEADHWQSESKTSNNTTGLMSSERKRHVCRARTLEQAHIYIYSV